GYSNSLTAPHISKTQESSFGKPLVSLRFIYRIDEARRDELRARYNNGPQYCTYLTIRERPPQVDALDEAVAKTTYYALQFYDVLARDLHDASVVLVPSVLTIDADGKVSLVEDVAVPRPTIIVDFFAHLDPAWTPCCGDLTATVGDYLYPIISIRTDQ